jgi:exodeoxyribonuclease VII large subunit
MLSPETAQLFEPEHTLGVGELVARVTRVVASAFPAEVWVRGEVHGYKPANASGHVYFELCERNNRRGPTSTLPVAIFRAEAERLRRKLREYPEFKLADGLEVRLKGRVQYSYGRLQLVVADIDPVHTLGQLAADRQRVLRALAADDLLQRNGSLPMPLLPLRLGVVTSVGSAAYEDVVHELTASGLGFTVLAADARVQGNGAELSIVRALTALTRLAPDLVLLVRGGGSRTDLVAFDGERLARAVATCPIPVLTGVGHEIDSCVVDEVAARALKTPTACAAAVVELARAAVDRSERAWAGVAATSTARLRRAEDQLTVAGARLAPERLGAVLDRAHATVLRAEGRLARGSRSALERRSSRLDVLEARVAAVDPVRALARGFSLTRRSDGRLVRSVADVSPGEPIVTVLADGRIESTVTETRRLTETHP